MNPLRKLYRVSSKLILETLGLNIVNYRNNTIVREDGLIQLLMSIRIEGYAFQSFEELLNIYRFSKATMLLSGDIAEVGVYKGGTARLLALNKGSRAIHLFDSFEGMVTSTSYDQHQRGDFGDTSLEHVKQHLFNFDNVHFHKGWFPETTKGLEKTQYSFVHLDVDLYQSTKDALNFFYPRLVSGGMLLSHDYYSLSCPGVVKAFREFFNDKPETILELAGSTQCLIIKR